VAAEVAEAARRVAAVQVAVEAAAVGRPVAVHQAEALAEEVARQVPAAGVACLTIHTRPTAQIHTATRSLI